MAKLLVHESAGIREFEMVDAEIHIGRELDNTLRLPDPSISRHHCVIRKTPIGWEIQDLQSSNGVLVNGTRVQSSPLRDGDRITLGQIQLGFQAPTEAGATVAVSKDALPQSPMGTVRMSAEQMAAIHSAAAGSDMPIELASEAPAPAPIPAMPPMPPPAAPAPAASTQSPSFGQFTNPGIPNPAPGFLQSFLPSIPDDARPTGERGELVERLIAVLIDIVPAIIIAIGFMILSVVPFLGCILLPINLLVQLSYRFLFVPWCVSTFGASIGKKMQKLRVVPLGQPEGRIGFGPAILREFGNFFFLNLIVLAVKGEERISLSDMLSGSEVLKVDK